MKWWSIVKSSRREAYSAFLEEFGPEVNLRSLEVESFLDDPENADVEYYLSVSNVSDEIMGHWVIQSNGPNIRFVSDKYPQYQEFVFGMFQQEYPKRYQEIVEMVKEASSQEYESQRDDLLQLVTKYLDVSHSIMELLRSRIIGSDMIDDRAKTSVVLPVSNPGYVRMLPEKIIPKLDVSGPSKSDIIFAIAELMVDRMVTEIHIFRSRETESRVNAIVRRYPNGFRDSLTSLYYGLLSTANSGGRKPGMVFNNAADNAARDLISYLEEVAGAYLGEES